MTQIDEIKAKPEKQELLKKMKLAVWIISLAVLGLVVLMREVKIPLPEGVSLTFFTTVSRVLELIGGFFIGYGFNIHKEKKCISASAMDIFSDVLFFIFLLSYVAYHFTTPETLYGDLNRDGDLNESELLEAGSFRKIYLFILLSHIALAAISLPFILLTFCYGFTNHFQKHKKLSRKIFPVWLYVAITGPGCLFYVNTLLLMPLKMVF